MKRNIVQPVFRIRIRFIQDTDPGSQNQGKSKQKATKIARKSYKKKEITLLLSYTNN